MRPMSPSSNKLLTMALGLWCASCSDSPTTPRSGGADDPSTGTTDSAPTSANVADATASVSKKDAGAKSTLDAGKPPVGASKPDASGSVTSPNESASTDAGSADAGATAPDAGADASPPGETCNITIPPSMDCNAKLAPGDQRTCMLGSRMYIVHAGKTMNPCKPVALVIDAHGATETAPEQLGTEKFCAFGGDLCWAGLGSGWAAESDTPGGGFIAVFPQGENNMWQASDADFMLQIVDQMKKVANLDSDKVYISGISNGGFLTFETGCPHSDVFHGMSPNSGGETCDSIKKPIPVISFDGMPDFAYDGNLSATTAMAKLNNCKNGPKPWLTIDDKYEEAVCRTAKQDVNAKLVPCSQVTSAKIEPTTCKIWDDCDDGVKVAFCDVAPNTEHGQDNAATDAHIIYENNTILNTPSVAWRFFKSFWKTP